MRTDWDDPAQATPAKVRTGCQKRNLNYKEDRVETARKEDAEGARAETEESVQGRCPAVCLIKKLHRKGGRGGEMGRTGEEADSGHGAGPVSGWTRVQVVQGSPADTIAPAGWLIQHLLTLQ